MYIGNQLARIHIGKKTLNMDDDTYQALLQRLTGKTSAKDCTVSQRAVILTEMTRLGAFKRATKPLTPQQKACIAKWYDLRRIGAVSSKDKSALNRYIKKHLGGWNVADLNSIQTNKLYNMLEQWLKNARR